MSRSMLILIIAVLVLLGGVAILNPRNTSTTVTTNEGTRVEAPGTTVESDNEKTRVQAPGVDITVPKAKTD